MLCGRSTAAGSRDGAPAAAGKGGSGPRSVASVFVVCALLMVACSAMGAGESAAAVARAPHELVAPAASHPPGSTGVEMTEVPEHVEAGGHCSEGGGEGGARHEAVYDDESLLLEN